MSRLIFEGDTTERFGKLFPKPFIQEIRVYDDAIQADVMLFLEVSLEQAETDVLISRINDNLRVFGAFLERDQFNRTINPNSQNDFYKNSFFTLDFNINDYERRFPLQNIEYHYNSEGKRFAKCLVTFDYTGISSFLNIARDRYFATFTSFTTPSSERGGTILEEFNLRAATPSENTLYRNQTSDLVYEKILNADGTLNTGKQNVYQEPDGNYYGKTPLQSLGKIYKQTNKITHQRVIDLVNPVVSPYVGSIPEADKISMTLSQYSNDPALLTQLEKDINSFTNKSSATTTGQLYSQLVDVVADIDNLLQAETTLNKRFEDNTKIKDKRGDQTLIGDSVDTTSTEHLDNQSFADDYEYIYPFMLQTTKNYYYDTEGNKTAEEMFADSKDEDKRDEIYVFKTSGYIFFDYEKTLNYKPNITTFFNTYNLEQIFGKNCLNSYYKIISYELSKRYVEAQSTAEVAYGLLIADRCLEMKIEDTYGDCAIQVNKEEKQFSSVKSLRASETPGAVELQREYTYLRVLPFKHIRNGANYKLIALEFVDFNKVDLQSYVRYGIEIEFADTTNQFYDTFMRQKVFDTFDKLSQYYEFANEFCSYNNLDNKFNDFFVSFITEQFDQPYPWEEAPLVYHSMRALLESSFNSTEDYTSSNRRKDGSLINMEMLKNQAILESNSINPATGDLQSLEDFYNKFQTLREVFVKGQGLDAGNTFYDPAQEGYELNSSESNYKMLKYYNFLQDYDLEIYNI